MKMFWKTSSKFQRDSSKMDVNKVWFSDFTEAVKKELDDNLDVEIEKYQLICCTSDHICQDLKEIIEDVGKGNRIMRIPVFFFCFLVVGWLLR